MIPGAVRAVLRRLGVNPDDATFHDPEEARIADERARNERRRLKKLRKISAASRKRNRKRG